MNARTHAEQAAATLARLAGPKAPDETAATLARATRAADNIDEQAPVVQLAIAQALTAIALQLTAPPNPTVRRL